MILMKGDLLEVTVDEVQQLWNVLQLDSELLVSFERCGEEKREETEGRRVVRKRKDIPTTSVATFTGSSEGAVSKIPATKRRKRTTRSTTPMSTPSPAPTNPPSTNPPSTNPSSTNPSSTNPSTYSKKLKYSLITECCMPKVSFNSFSFSFFPSFFSRSYYILQFCNFFGVCVFHLCVGISSANDELTTATIILTSHTPRSHLSSCTTSVHSAPSVSGRRPPHHIPPKLRRMSQHNTAVTSGVMPSENTKQVNIQPNQQKHGSSTSSDGLCCNEEMSDKEEEDEEEEEGECSASICHQPVAEQISWVQCDHCQEWFHCVCVGLTKAYAEKIDCYICKRCQGLGFTVGGAPRRPGGVVVRGERTRGTHQLGDGSVPLPVLPSSSQN